MASPRSHDSIQQIIGLSLRGNKFSWPKSVYTELNIRGVIKFTDNYPDEDSIKELIKQEIDEYHKKLELRMSGSSLNMCIYNILIGNSLLKLPQ